MQESNDYHVTLAEVTASGIAVIRARLPAHRVGAQFGDYLDEVYAVGRAGTVQLDGQNIFVYRDADGAPGHLDVEFGVGVAAPFAAQGGVDYGLTPGGEAATTTHWGNFGALGDGSS